jgi:hypothetical protein
VPTYENCSVGSDDLFVALADMKLNFCSENGATHEQATKNTINNNRKLLISIKPGAKDFLVEILLL